MTCYQRLICCKYAFYSRINKYDVFPSPSELVLMMNFTGDKNKMDSDAYRRQLKRARDQIIGEYQTSVTGCALIYNVEADDLQEEVLVEVL